MSEYIKIQAQITGNRDAALKLYDDISESLEWICRDETGIEKMACMFYYVGGDLNPFVSAAAQFIISHDATALYAWDCMVRMGYAHCKSSNKFIFDAATKATMRLTPAGKDAIAMYHL